MRGALLAGLLLASPATAEESLAQRAVAFETAPVVPSLLGHFELRIDAASTRPLDGPGATAARLVLSLPLGDWRAYASAQAEPCSDPEAQVAIGAARGPFLLELAVPEVEADPWQEPPAPVVVIGIRGAL